MTEKIRSSNYSLVCAHYKALLSEHYTWTFGGAEGKYDTFTQILAKYLQNTKEKQVLDLGCGSGFQSIPLIKLGCMVTSIDLSSNLLEELHEQVRQRKLDENNIITICGDLLDFKQLVQNQCFDDIICMGDTLIHLSNVGEVKQLIDDCYDSLNADGRLVLQYQDLTKPLHGTDRFIPVRSDERTVYTCFLEWNQDSARNIPGQDESGCIITVNDLVHVKKGIGAWELCKSSYPKLGLTAAFAMRLVEQAGFRIIDGTDDSGMVTIVCQRDDS